MEEHSEHSVVFQSVKKTISQPFVSCQVQNQEMGNPKAVSIKSRGIIDLQRDRPEAKRGRDHDRNGFGLPPGEGAREKLG
jgi:hypothetical protein